MYSMESLVSGFKYFLSLVWYADILFTQYPDLKQAYSLTHNLRVILTQTKNNSLAHAKVG
ncbi:hypothetical protein BZG01_16480 [Labilibaculum manganireducens]|uniref:Uncharacterized protein n=2 Tax=Labilibaculum manganireducens TaxID=1940525 RepID=A0A2N3HY46_9BACT|nr:hypothetical protein BZG01_16480 [Labilibaculum manganireducens]